MAGVTGGHEKAPERRSAAGATQSINFVGLCFVLLLVKQERRNRDGRLSVAEKPEAGENWGSLDRSERPKSSRHLLSATLPGRGRQFRSR
jgi:hypothetical protein